MTEAKVACRTPAEGRDGVTNIPEWKFERLRAAILDSLGEGDLPQTELKDKVAERLSLDELERMGKLGWHVVTVRLELEVRGEVARREGRGPVVVGMP